MSRKQTKMVLYQLVLILRASQRKDLLDSAKLAQKKMLRSVVTGVLDRQGVVRTITNMGYLESLPYRMRKNKIIHSSGHYYSIMFDASPKTLAYVDSFLRAEDDCIRHTAIKQPGSFRDLTKYVDPIKRINDV